jgi:hypothetical protein
MEMSACSPELSVYGDGDIKQCEMDFNPHDGNIKFYYLHRQTAFGTPFTVEYLLVDCSICTRRHATKFDASTVRKVFDNTAIPNTDLIKVVSFEYVFTIQAVVILKATIFACDCFAQKYGSSTVEKIWYLSNIAPCSNLFVLYFS